MLTDNTSISDRLINGSFGRVKHLDVTSKPLSSTIYVKLNDSKAGNSLKDRRLWGELKEYTNYCQNKEFLLKRGNNTVIAERKQFPLIFSHAITAHKSQGSTLDYMQGNLNWSTGKKTAVGKSYQQRMSQGQFYILLYCAKSRNKFLLLNFDVDDIKVNESTLEKIVPMIDKSLLS